MQSAGGEGIGSVVAQRAGDLAGSSVRNEDIVVWHTFGSTHNPLLKTGRYAGGEDGGWVETGQFLPGESWPGCRGVDAGEESERAG